MPDNGGLDTAAGGTKNVDAGDGFTLDGVTSSDDFCVIWICGSEVRQKCYMVRVGMIGVEPGWCGDTRFGKSQ